MDPRNGQPSPKLCQDALGNNVAKGMAHLTHLPSMEVYATISIDNMNSRDSTEACLMPFGYYESTSSAPTYIAY